MMTVLVVISTVLAALAVGAVALSAYDDKRRAAHVRALADATPPFTPGVIKHPGKGKWA